MEFRNHTPFPALAFEGIDQHEQSFHVLALRQTLTWDESGQLDYADEQAPLCGEDEFFGEPNLSSVRQESDLCHYKPRCDVIVNATAHAPKGKAARRFPVRLAVRRPDTPARLPEPPHPLNPFMPVTASAQAQWQREVDKVRAHPSIGPKLIDKTLIVTGPRQFKKKWVFTRLVQWAIKWSTLTIIRPNPWKLTRPKKIALLPLRYETAYGGQCRINQKDNAHLAAGDPKKEAKLKNSNRLAKYVPKKFRFTPEQLVGHPDLDAPVVQLPVAHAVCETNPIGIGFAQTWFLEAVDRKQVSAPQIERPDTPITARLFWKAVRGKLRAKDTVSLEPAGLGIRPKTHPARRVLVGTIDKAFIESNAPLPADFDFAVWNAAPVDQQTDFLAGDEILELTNLCSSDTPGVVQNTDGDSRLKLELPRHECFALVRLDSGEMFDLPLGIDTLIIEPENCRLTLVWRAVLAKDDDAPIRVLEARMHTFADRDIRNKAIEKTMARMPHPEATEDEQVAHE